MAREKKYFTDAQVSQIATMAGLGMPVEQIAHVIGVSKKTFERRLIDQPDVNDALSKGRAIASMQVRRTAFQMATSGKHPALTIFWLKTREGWKEPREDGDDPSDLEITLNYQRKPSTKEPHGTQETGAKRQADDV